MRNPFTRSVLSAVLLLTWGCGDEDPPSDPCTGVTCSSHGSCVALGDTPRCECDPGFVTSEGGRDCRPWDPPPEPDSVLNDAHLIQLVELNTKVDLAGILDSDLGASREGDFVWQGIRPAGGGGTLQVNQRSMGMRLHA